MNDKQKVLPLVKELQAELDRQKINLTIFPGQEVRLYGEMLKDMEDNKILFVDDQKQNVLIEFPTESIPSYSERLFYDLQSNGKTPIIVHPERNHEIIEHPNCLKNLVDKGGLAQLTVASYTGGFGKEIEKLSKELIEGNLVHFIASDAHNTTNRSFHMKEAYELLAKEYGRSKRNTFHQITKDLLNGDPVIMPDTHTIKKSFLSKWFN